eukprot:762804-Hanusia_phi.AAC.5
MGAKRRPSQDIVRIHLRRRKWGERAEEEGRRRRRRLGCGSASLLNIARVHPSQGIREYGRSVLGVREVDC